jgi:Protein of unknown function (DUF3592)
MMWAPAESTSSLPNYWWFLALVAGVGLEWAVREWRERRAQSWPTVQGTVEWTWVRVEGSGRHQRSIPEVCYSYTVNGEYYSGTHECFDLSRFPKGLCVQVHYKPSDPSVSFLDREEMRAREEADG